MSSPERLRDELERTHSEISQHREFIDFCRARGRAPPDHYYRDLDILHTRYDQLSLALAESHQAFASSRRGRSLVVASPRVASPTDAPHPPRPDSSSLKGPRLSPQPGPSSSGEQRFATQDRRRPRDASSDLSRRNRLSEERSRERFATSARSSDSRRFGSRDSPSPRRKGFASRGSPSLQRQGFASRGSSSPKRQDSLQGIPPLQSDGVSLQGTLFHLDFSTHPVLRLVMALLRDPHRGLLLPVHLHLLGKIRKLTNLLFQPRLGL